MNYGNSQAVQLSYSRINPDKFSIITTRQQVKTYSPICKKGILKIEENDNQQMTILPFGYMELFS